jgi:hypothetical protein
VIVDPASGPVEGDAPGVNPIVFQHATHPATRGLDGTRMVFFRRARPVLASASRNLTTSCAPSPSQSRRSWLAPNAAAVQRGAASSRRSDARTTGRC